MSGAVAAWLSAGSSNGPGPPIRHRRSTVEVVAEELGSEPVVGNRPTGLGTERGQPTTVTNHSAERPTTGAAVTDRAAPYVLAAASPAATTPSCRSRPSPAIPAGCSAPVSSP
jgi:hypothetical protein